MCFRPRNFIYCKINDKDSTPGPKVVSTMHSVECICSILTMDNNNWHHYSTELCYCKVLWTLIECCVCVCVCAHVLVCICVSRLANDFWKPLAMAIYRPLTLLQCLPLPSETGYCIGYCHSKLYTVIYPCFNITK